MKNSLVAAQESVVHVRPSSQESALPGAHVPPEQASPTVQALLSVHGKAFAV